MRAAIYTRISQDASGQELGVTRQLEDCTALAERLGWEVVTVHTDNDLSAYSGKTRPGFEALLDGMKTGLYDALICWHTDRLYRSMKDLERLIEIADAAKVEIRTVQGGTLDLSTSAGRMVARILGSVARQESEHSSERRVRAYVQKAENGRWQTANRPFGYTMTGEPLEPEATAYRTAVADVLAGKSIQAIAKQWNAAGLRTTLAGTTYKGKTVSGEWNSPRVRRLLVNPRYAALKVHRGRIVGPGNWTPLIDEGTHRGLVAFLSDPKRIKCTSFERKYIGSGVYRCGVCGGLMKAAQPGGRKSRAYVCADHSHVLRSGEPLDAYIESIVVGRLSRADAHLLLDDKRVDLPALQAERIGVQARLDELADQFAEGAIDGSQLRRGTGTLRSKLAVIDSQLADAARTDPVAGLIADKDRVAEKWAACTPSVQGQIIDSLMVVTVLPCPKGRRTFDASYIDIVWKTQ